MTPKHKAKSQQDRSRELPEWIVAGLAGIAVASVFGFLCFQALTTSDTPPTLTAQAVTVREDHGLHHVLVSVRNWGDEAAADAQVSGRVSRDGEEHTATATLDYAPANTGSEVTLVFSLPVEPADVEVHVEGFRAP